MLNSIGRQVPEHIPGYRVVKPYLGAYGAPDGQVQIRRTVSGPKPEASKLLPDVAAAIDACGLKDGDTISFHHHLRNGDHVMNRVLAEIARRGLRDIRVAASSFFPVHAPIIEHIASGVVGGLSATYISGPLGEALVRGALREPVIMMTHGGRARAIESGDITVDVAFIAAPAADASGNLNGVQGPSACGTLGYGMVDARFARRVVAITDHLVPYPASPADITQDLVDFVVRVDRIGDPQGIASGTTRATQDPVGLAIAHRTAQVVAASGLLKEGFSFQTGAGGISLAVADELRQIMVERGIRGSFASGGITGYLVDMFEAGLFRSLFDVQCFDLKAVDSYRRNVDHQCMSASLYANPHTCGPVVNNLDVVILGAAEVDRDFHVNVTTGTDGVILGGSGGHADTAAGAKLAIVTTKLKGGGFAKVVDQVTTVTTPGETVDVLVTEAGVAVNPLRGELRERLIGHGVEVLEIDALIAAARAEAGLRRPPPQTDRVAAVVEYRDGSVIDVVRTLA
ncbi:citrate lyase subunit alpha [Methyloversatilis thermotolerans]|uniref:citrate lyase subunit alpha n=1 Tax=Methyloversatilis thermotolerans TaxID=1346290 RepID=UPI00035C45DB|nr:citrate lyase subunit alpha [Methyloversatilis thermotolerans]